MMTHIGFSSIALLPLALVTAGCGRPAKPAAEKQDVDINGAAQEAQGDIDTYASNALQTPGEAAASAPLPPPEPVSAEPAALGGQSGRPPEDGAPPSEASFAADDGLGAADIVQRYFALIEAGRFSQAWALWSDDGKASGMDADAFAASFAKYAEYHANVGTPGPVDAGAGQRYVTVPVQVYGVIEHSGAPFNLRGNVVLHRIAAIDGATATDRSWHIASADLKPEPAGGMTNDDADDAVAASTAPPPPGPISGGAEDIPATAAADYRCDDGFAFHILFDNDADTGTISVDGRRLAVLDAQRAASGIWYASGGYVLRGKGDEADVTRPGASATHCMAH